MQQGNDVTRRGAPGGSDTRPESGRIRPSYLGLQIPNSSAEASSFASARLLPMAEAPSPSFTTMVAVSSAESSSGPATQRLTPTAIAIRAAHGNHQRDDGRNLGMLRANGGGVVGTKHRIALGVGSTSSMGGALGVGDIVLPHECAVPLYDIKRARSSSHACRKKCSQQSYPPCRACPSP